MVGKKGMDWPIIHNSPAQNGAAPGFGSLIDVVRSFSWEAARGELDALAEVRLPD